MIKDITELFQHSIFKKSIKDIESLGLRVVANSESGAMPYAVIGARSNARWWLVPLANRHMTTNGLALFQPLLISAKLIKATVVILSRLGLSRLWVKQQVFIIGNPVLGQYFPQSLPLSYSYFTGTDSPHRKIAVQIMDLRGHLLGFAKVTRSSQVAELLAHEAAILSRLSALNFQATYIPNVLFFGKKGEGTLLVTDTLKTAGTKSVTKFIDAHRVFLQELVKKTAQPPCSIATIVAGFKTRIENILPRFSLDWHHRLDKAIVKLSAEAELVLPMAMNHGDFTPWNCFLTNGRLYVFDWEYAEELAPIGIDIIHFTFNESKLRGMHVTHKLEAAIARLSEPWMGLVDKALPSILIIYLLTQVLRQVERQPEGQGEIVNWDGVSEQACMLDTVLKT